MQHSSLMRKTSAQCIALFLLIALCMLLTACTANISSDTGTSIPGTTTSSGTTCQSATCTTGTGTQNVQVFVEPAAGDGVITRAIQGAKKSVWMEMYLLTDRNVINALEDAAHRGIDTRVMLEAHPYGSGSISPTQTLDRLKAAGVQTNTSSPSFALTHEKGLVIDGSTAYIMSCNMTLSALGGSSSTTNREYGIVDTTQQDVQTVSDIFTADWNRSSVQPNDPNLVVSPINSRDDFISLIGSAKKTLVVEAEEMQDSSVEQALVNAAKSGVQVQVILPSGSTNDSGIATIKQGGVQVKEDQHYYMHAKMMVIDGQRGFVGSENISTASLDKNRELGIILSDQSALQTLQQTFQQDWGESQSV